MSIFSIAESGTSFHRTRFTKSISYTKRYDCMFGEGIPVLAKFCLPGDIWKVAGNALVRFQPMLSPTLTPNILKVRYFFVPLRLIETNTELITTGSKDGHLYTGVLPEFKNFLADADTNLYPNSKKVQKWSFWDYMGVQPGDYSTFVTDRCLPAQYWSKGYARIFWDYYDDENIGFCHQTYADFDTYAQFIEKLGGQFDCFPVSLKKDYFASSLPWQLKGTAPILNVTGTATFTPNFSSDFFTPGTDGTALNYKAGGPFQVPTADYPSATGEFLTKLNQAQSGLTITGLGFDGDELRTMMAETRIFERAARTGSRYTEYLRANFGIAPADETLQRAQYLGGWSLPIVTTEVLQTAEDGANPVGTMRGHGITRGGNTIKPFICKEFGMIFGIAHIIPETEYTTGIPRELTYKSRFDFFNPSLQHLSEQEVRNGELFIGTDGKNDDTFGFQAYANELRSSFNQTVGDLRDSLSYWTQALHFTSRPNLNSAFIESKSHRASYNAPFVVNNPLTARPCIVQFANILDVYRPMVRYATPGLVDHL